MSLIQLVLNGNGYLNISGDITSSGYIQLTTDPDALNYIQRVGITNSSIQTNITNFIFGLKDLNLWDNTINIYLLNSGYNATTGTKIYGLRTGYDGNLINSGQATWTSSGIFLGSGSGTSDGAYLSSGKAAITHPVLPVFDGNFTISILGKTTNDAYGAWWHQNDRSSTNRSIWLQPNAYFYQNEVAYGDISSGSISYAGSPRLNTANQYNLISYDVKYISKTIYSGSGSLNIYKDGLIQVTTQTGAVVLPSFCIRQPLYPYYPCDQHTGCINGTIDLQPDGKMIGVKSQGYYSFAGAFSRVLSSGEHLAVKNLLLSTIAQNISLG
jgi:hypothetical protein